MQSSGPGPSPSLGAPRGPLLAALLAGLAALVAQTLWIRALGRAVGTTGEALAVVAAVFLGGVGLGSAWGGRLACRGVDPQRAAARCLLLASALVLVSPWLFGLLPEGHLWILGALGQEPGPSPLPALLLALPLLLAPTLLMGASFPLLVAARPVATGRSGRSVGALYGLNTLGAALGVPASVLALATLGERLSLAAAAACQILAALCLGSRAAEPASSSAGAADAAPDGAAAATPRTDAPTPPALLATLTLAGAAGLGAEVAAFRLLEPLTGSHAWGLVLLLLPVLLGIALGGWVGGLVADRVPAPRLTLASLLVLAGVLLAAALPIAGTLPGQLLRLGAPDAGQRLLTLTLGSFLVLLAPMAALGACFPLAVRAAVAEGTAPARAAGDLAGWNCAGSVLGSLLTGFLALPHWGAPLTLLFVAALLLAAAPAVRRRAGRPVGLVVCVLPLLALALPVVRERLVGAAPRLPEIVAATAHRPPIVRRARGEPFVMSLTSAEDVRLYAEWFGARPARRGERRDSPPEPVREGRVGTVALLEEPGGVVRVRVNGLSEARMEADDPDRGSPTEVALGLLPTLAHRAPRRALVIGHGAGWTVEAVLAAGVPSVEVAELDATVLEAVASWRGHPLAVRSDPRARLLLTDGRLLLRRAAHDPERRYDVIASQPSHPWVPGAGHLFTRQAYELAREALTDGGAFAQWINLFEMSPGLLKRALATFAAVFPRCWLFLFEGEVVMLGIHGSATLDPERWERMLGQDADLRRMAGKAGFEDVGDLWRHLTLDAQGLAALAPPAQFPPVDDDLPTLELGLAWRVLTQAEEHAEPGARPADLMQEIRRHFPPDWAGLLPTQAARERWTAWAADSLRRDGELARAAAWEERGVWGNDAESRRVRALLARARRQTASAEHVLRTLVKEQPERVDWLVEWMDVMAEGVPMAPDMAPTAMADAARAAARFANDGRVRAAQARLHEACGDALGSRAHYQAALLATAPPAPDGTAAALARLLIALGPEPDGGAPGAPDRGHEGYALELLRGDPGALTSRTLLELWAPLERRLGDPERAQAVEAALLELERTSALAARRAAWFWLVAGDPAALREAQQATWSGPTSVEGFELLGLARLQAAARESGATLRAELEAGALEALHEAWQLAGRRPEQERRGRAYLAWFGIVPPPTAPEAPR